MLTIFDLVVIVVTCLAVFFDLRQRRIPNWLILSGLAFGTIFYAMQGLTPFLYSLIGFVLGIAVLFIPFAFGWMGAGDVKYLGLIGALLGYQLLPRVLFYSVLIAGVLALYSAARGRASAGAFKKLWIEGKLAFLSFGTILPDSMQQRAANGAHSIPWGVAIGAGTIVARYLDSTGRWAGI